MIRLIVPYKKIIPDEYVQTINDIDYNKLYSMGKRIILTDLDNTLVSYKVERPTPEIFEWKKMVEEIGFEVIIVSNNNKDRVKLFADELGVPYYAKAMKPLKKGFKRGIKLGSRKYDASEVLEIGDQLLTDVFGSKRMGYYTVLVRAIDHKTEKWTTRFNRKNEVKMLKKCKKKNPSLYRAKLEAYEKENL